PGKERLPVKAGDLLGWSGKSGTGQPHLHIEVRVGDLALNPLRAGLPVREVAPPRLISVTLEPLDENSWVERGAAALTLALSGPPADPVLAEGRIRVLVRAYQPGLRGANLVPWRLRAVDGAQWVEWRADSASWATDMNDVDYVYDVGRSVPPG